MITVEDILDIYKGFEYVVILIDREMVNSLPLSISKYYKTITVYGISVLIQNNKLNNDNDNNDINISDIQMKKFPFLTTDELIDAYNDKKDIHYFYMHSSNEAMNEMPKMLLEHPVTGIEMRTSIDYNIAVVRKDYKNINDNSECSKEDIVDDIVDYLIDNLSTYLIIDIRKEESSTTS